MPFNCRMAVKKKAKLPSTSHSMHEKNQQILGNDSMVLSEIHIQGNNTTRSAFLRALLQPAIQTTTLQACYGASKEAVERLQRLDIFDSVEMRLQPRRESSSPSSSSSDKDINNNMDMDMDLILVVKEKKKLVFATGTAVDQHGVHLVRHIFFCSAVVIAC